MTREGGSMGYGVVFKVDTTGNHYTVLHNFTGGHDDGATSDHGYVVQSGHHLYGMTTNGGHHNDGVIFKLNIDDQTFDVLHRFGETNSDGKHPYGSLLLVRDKLYGTTQNGNVFTITPSGTFATIFTFPADGTGGARPSGEILRASDNSLWGVTAFGGANGEGTVFKIVNSIVTAPVVSLPAGFNPLAGLIQGTDGNFYGTATDFGDAGGGTIFKLTPAGVLTILHTM